MLNNKKLHFMHIPKTGGSSLTSFIEFQFSEKETCPAHYLHNKTPLDWVKDKHVFNNFTKVDLQKYQFFRGHLGWLPRTIFTADNIETITFLRDPIERLVSVYGHIMRDKAAFPKLCKRWPSIDDFLNDEEAQPLIANQQVQHFCADKRKGINTYSDDLQELLGIWSFDIALSEEDKLELALQRLNQCEFIGLMENYDKSFKDLCEKYNWIAPHTVPKINVTASRIQQNDLSGKTINKILKLNQLDLRLYQHAKELRNYRSLSPQRKIKNTIVQKLPESIDFSFSDKLIGQNWHPREKTPDGVFCWSSAKEASLVFHIQAKNNLILSFNIINCFIEDIHKSLSCSVNGKPIILFLEKNELQPLLAKIKKFILKKDKAQPQPKHPAFGTYFYARISKKLLRKDGELALTFSIPHTTKPSEVIANSEDNRNLGIACMSVKLEPDS